MPGIEAVYQSPACCLLRCEGPQAGFRYELRSPVTRIGRAAGNDVVLAGPDATIVSARHAEIRDQDGHWIIRDLDSTNGTFVNGQRCAETALELNAIIQFGPGGPTLTLTTWDEAGPSPDLNRTLAVAPEPTLGGLDTEHGRLLSQAVDNARRARWSGSFNQTGAIMREAMVAVLERSSRRFWRIIAGLVCLLIAVTALGVWRIRMLGSEKAAIDGRIGKLERAIQAASANPNEVDRLIGELDRSQSQAQALEKNPLYRLRERQPQNPLDASIRTLLAEFGAEVYSIPPEFRDAVTREMNRYQGEGRPLMARALGEARPEMGRIERILETNHLPPDFAYMVLVESAMDPAGKSEAGGAGLWQLTPATARAFGLSVGEAEDQRLDLVKATHAAAAYLRSLILDFGAGSSVMLAMAAYDVGPARVKQAIRRVQDPIRQRDFWYLYRTHALPEETREYVPKVIAAMIIGRDPARYGF